MDGWIVACDVIARGCWTNGPGEEIVIGVGRLEKIQSHAKLDGWGCGEKVGAG